DITIECWPRFVDVTKADARQFPGWPITINQQENYNRGAIAWLPELRISGAPDPVLRVIAEDSGEVVYTLRIRGKNFRPKVFKEGSYTLRVGEGEAVVVLEGIESTPEPGGEPIEVEL
ncbi:MAG: twin-arginine translocation pathway signal protein, partial [Verrucomicrobiales bacterium]